ncbi:hypothetical protein VTJ04DRAFT_9330 [Mycothermus thermophilus]|uniref:uncharacterized protein n=1 Tax=Humicola insolens TaxID=85995 RepID=UPI0037444162
MVEIRDLGLSEVSKGTTKLSDGSDAQPVVNIIFPSNQNSIYEHTKDFIAKLSREVEEDTLPIIFVAHSLGGVIVKDAITKSDMLRERTKLVVFFGTPHRGSSAAEWAEMGARLAKYLLGTTATVVGDLKLNSQMLHRIHDEFTDNAHRHKIRVHSFQEALPYPGLNRRIIEPFSSRLDLGSELETTETIHANHQDMVRFSQKDDEGYNALRSVLRKCIRSIPEDLGDSLDENEQHQVQQFASDYVTARQLVDKAHPGTCEWILSNDDFVSWINGPSTTLWISGHPGMGKTVLAKFLLEYFENSSPPRKTVHFFFSDRDGTRRSPINFLKAAIHQFIQHSSRSFTKYVKPRLDKFGPEVHTSLGLLWDIFYEMTQDSSLGPVVCVLDALDEADPKTWEDLIKRLGNNFSHTPSSTHFKFIITSRPYDKINTHFSRFCVLRLRAENEDHHIHQDITLFVEAEVPRLAEHRKYPENLQKMVKDALITGSGGMFLWVHLMLAILWQTPVSDVRQRLEQAPKDIDAVYDRIIAELSPQLADTATKILKWLVFGNRPLTVDELNLLSPLLRVKGNRVYLVHHTAKEYLLKLNAKQMMWTETGGSFCTWLRKRAT